MCDARLKARLDASQIGDILAMYIPEKIHCPWHWRHGAARRVRCSKIDGTVNLAPKIHLQDGSDGRKICEQQHNCYPH